MSNLRMFPGAQQLVKPVGTQEEVCPSCHFPLADTAHGWVKDYWTENHIHSEKCYRKYGFCLVPCPMCSGGVEAKRQAQMIADLFGDAHIPHYARGWTFASFPETGDTQALRQVQAQVQFWLQGERAKHGLYIKGNVGHGKTSLAISAVHMWLRKGHSGVFLTTVELFDLLKGSIGAAQRVQHGDGDYQDRYESSQGAKLLRLVKSVELLVLDDLGVECGSRYEIRELYLILEARRSQGLYTIFTSNCDAKDLQRHWRPENAKEAFADTQRIIDRLGEYCFLVPVAGGNLRQQAERKA